MCNPRTHPHWRHGRTHWDPHIHGRASSFVRSFVDGWAGELEFYTFRCYGSGRRCGIYASGGCSPLVSFHACTCQIVEKAWDYTPVSPIAPSIIWEEKWAATPHVQMLAAVIRQHQGPKYTMAKATDKRLHINVMHITV